MAVESKIQLNKIGEHLVAGELARRGILVTRLHGRNYDIIAADPDGHLVPIQVKVSRGKGWRFTADHFVEVSFEGKKQKLGSKIISKIPNILCILVLVVEYGKDRFFILEWEQLQDIVVSNYKECLAANDYVMPGNFRFVFCDIAPEQLAQYENLWDKVTERVS